VVLLLLKHFLRLRAASLPPLLPPLVVVLLAPKPLK